MPSAKYCCSGSLLRLTKGGTAIDGHAAAGGPDLTPRLEARALQVAEQICQLRWASISELYRSEVLGEKEILPSGVA